jgi:hypothetical protein
LRLLGAEIGIVDRVAAVCFSRMFYGRRDRRACNEKSAAAGSSEPRRRALSSVSRAVDPHP